MNAHSGAIFLSGRSVVGVGFITGKQINPPNPFPSIVNRNDRPQPQTFAVITKGARIAYRMVGYRTTPECDIRQRWTF